MDAHRAGCSVRVLENAKDKLPRQVVAAFIAAVTSFLLLSSVLAPIFEMLGLYQAAYIIDFPISTICHQLPSRCLTIFGVQTAICSRCFGFYLTVLLSSIVYFFASFLRNFISTRMLLLLVTPLVLDGTTQLYGLRTSTNALRFGTGVVAGVGVGLFILPSLTNLWTRLIYCNREGQTLRRAFSARSAALLVAVLFFVLLAGADIVSSSNRGYDEQEQIRRWGEKLDRYDREQREAARRRADEKELEAMYGSDDGMVWVCCFGIIVAIVVAIAHSSNQKRTEEASKKAIEDEKRSQRELAAERLAKAESLGFSVENETKVCPACKEKIKLMATICRFCRKEFSADQVERALNAKVDSFLPPNPNFTVSIDSAGSVRADSPSMPLESLTPQQRQLMEQFNITYDGEHYHFGEYRYEKFSDALNYAKLQASKC